LTLPEKPSKSPKPNFYLDLTLTNPLEQEVARRRTFAFI
jgi:hypothetical protein